MVETDAVIQIDETVFRRVKGKTDVKTPTRYNADRVTRVTMQITKMTTKE